MSPRSDAAGGRLGIARNAAPVGDEIGGLFLTIDATNAAPPVRSASITARCHALSPQLAEANKFITQTFLN